MAFHAELGDTPHVDWKDVLKHQVEFQEPRVRINTDLINSNALDWDEGRAWDEIAGYYSGLDR